MSDIFPKKPSLMDISCHILVPGYSTMRYLFTEDENDKIPMFIAVDLSKTVIYSALALGLGLHP